MLRELGEEFGNVVLEGIGRTTSRVQEQKPLSVDLLESDDAFLAVFDAPGVTSTDIDVRFDDHVIHVRIDRFRNIYDEFEMRFPGRGMSLSGSVSLPENVSVDDGAASATVTTAGTLQVNIPKTEPDSTDEPIRIETESSDAASESDTDNESDAADESENTEE
jgi:HSP20 family protein